MQLIAGDGIHRRALGQQVGDAVGPHIQQGLVVGAELDLAGLLVAQTLDAGGCQTLAHGDDLADMADVVLVGYLVDEFLAAVLHLLTHFQAGQKPVLQSDGLDDVDVDGVAPAAYILLEVAQQDVVKNIDAPVVLHNVGVADLTIKGHVGLYRVKDLTVEIGLQHGALLALVGGGADQLIEQVTGGADIVGGVALAELQSVHHIVLPALQGLHLLPEGEEEALIHLAQVVQVLRTEGIGLQLGGALAEFPDVLVIVGEELVEFLIELVVSAGEQGDGLALVGVLLRRAQIVQVGLHPLGLFVIEHTGVVGVGGVQLQPGQNHIVQGGGGGAHPLVHLDLGLVEHIAGGVGVTHFAEGVLQQELQSAGALFVGGLVLVHEQGLGGVGGHLLGPGAQHGLIVAQLVLVLHRVAPVIFVFIVDLGGQGIGGVPGGPDGGVGGQGGDHFLIHGLEEVFDPLVRIVEETGVQILGEIVGGGTQLAGIYLAAGGNLALGQALLDGVLLGHIIGVVILGPLGHVAFAADAVHGPAVGDVVGNILIGVADHAGADAAEAVAAQVAGVGHLLDDVVLHGKGVGLHGADVLLVQGLGGLGLILLQVCHGGILGVLAVHQEAEVEGQQGQALELIGAGIGKINVQILIAAEIAVAHVHKAGALHHEGVDLLDGGVGVAALALPLGGGVDDAVQSLGQQDHRAHDQRGVGIFGVDIIPDDHRQRQDDARAGAAGGGGGNDNTHGLLEGLAVLAEQVVNGVIQRFQLAGLDGGVEGQTGDGTHLTGALGNRLVVHDGVLGEPVFQSVLIVVQVVTHGLGVGGLDIVDMGAAFGNVGQVVDVGVQTDKIDVFLLARAALLCHPFDDVAAGTANTDKQGGRSYDVFLDDLFAHVIPS